MAPVLDNKAEETPEEVEVGDEKDQRTPDKLIQIASNIHEIVVKPNGEPIKTVRNIGLHLMFIFYFITGRARRRQQHNHCGHY